MTARNVATALLEQLSAWGVKNLYGFIGDDLFYLFDALARQHSIKFYQVRHEETAAFMASAYAKLTDEIGVCIADGGPGTLHLLNGLADAFADNIPVLAITGQVARKDIGTNTKQYVDQQSLFRPLVSYTALLSEPTAAGKLLEKAFRSAVSTRSVAHISIPMDILPMPCDVPVIPPFPYLYTYPASSQQVIEAAAEMLQKAHRPVILAGLGARRAGRQIAELAGRWGAAIVTALPGTGVVEGSHPLYVGGLGHAGCPASAELLSQADMCLIVGANWWPQQYVPASIPVVQVEAFPEDIGSTTPVAYGIVGTAENVINSLLNLLNVSPNQEWLKNIERLKTQWLEQLKNEICSQANGVHPAAVVSALQETSARDAVICLDTGDNTVWFGRVFRPARQRVILSGKWRSMGFGMPAALASKIACPDRQVLALVGDGGFAMNMSDFLTAVKYNLPITIVIMNNGALAMERNKMQAGGLIPEGTELLNPDFAAFARCCGGLGYTVEKPEQLVGTLRDALGSNRPAVIDVKVDALPVPGTKMPQ